MQLHKKYLFFIFMFSMQRDIFLKGPLEGGKGQKVRTHDIFYKPSLLEYNNGTNNKKVHVQ